MLSKFYQQKIYNKLSDDILKKNIEAIMKNNYDLIELEPVSPGGTLGIFFRATTTSGTFFIKTHQTGERAYNNLCNEIEILQHLYGDELHIRGFNIFSEQNAHAVLVMDQLSTLTNLPSKVEISTLVTTYQKKLETTESDIKQKLYQFDELLELATQALEVLPKAGLLQKTLASRIDEVLFPLRKEKPSCLCHGDLSNKNVMEKNGKLYVIDWEDTVWGIPDYDVCYWMTFFDQRKYYDEDFFSELKIDGKRGKMLMVLSVLLKCFLSYHNNNYHDNKLSFDERIEEILQLNS